MKSLKIFSLAFLLLTVLFVSVALGAPTQAPPAGGAIQVTPSANNQGALTIDTNGVVNLTDALPLTSGGTGRSIVSSTDKENFRADVFAAQGYGQNSDITSFASSGAKTASHTGWLMSNSSTSSTASITKTGLDIQSTGVWNGASAINIGLNVNVTGGTTNYAAIFQGGNVGIGTTAVGAKLTLADHTANTGGIRFRTAATAVDLWSSGSDVLKTAAALEAGSYRVGTTEIITSGRVLRVADGTVSAPGLSFSSDTNVGIYRGGTDILKLVTTGVDRLTIDAAGAITIPGNLTVSGTCTGCGGGAPTGASYITKTADTTLTGEFALSTLGTGLLKNTTATGDLSIAVAGTDYVAPGGNVATATALAANGTNCGAGFYSMGVDASGNAEGCTSAGGSGTVTSVSVTTANGVSGTVANATTTPAISLTLGAITPTTVNGLTLASQSTGFTIAGGTTTSKTLTVSENTTVPVASQLITLAGPTAARTYTFPDTNSTIMALAATQTVTGAKTFNSSTLLLAGSTSGTTTLNASAAASGTLTLPAATDTLVGRATTDTLTNKTIAFGSNTVSGTTAQFNTANTDADFYTTGGTDVVVADGGTGRSTLTTGTVLLGNGTSQVTMLSGSANNDVLTWNGTSWVSAGNPANAWTRTGTTVSLTNSGDHVDLSGGLKLGLAPASPTTINMVLGLDATATTITVASTSGYPTAGIIFIDSEAMAYTGVNGTQFTGVTRGALGTTATTHTNGSAVNNYLQVVQSTSSLPRMVLTGAGNLGLGITAPPSTRRLNIKGTGSTSSSHSIYITDSTNGNIFSVDDDGNTSIGGGPDAGYRLKVTGGDVRFLEDLEVAQNITTASCSGCTTPPSDIRLKENIVPLAYTLEKLKHIAAIKFDYKTEEFPDKHLEADRQIGLIAQEVEKYFPELVEYDSQGYRKLDYGKFSSVLLQAIKEQQIEIERQGSALLQLQKDMQALKKAIKK